MWSNVYERINDGVSGLAPNSSPSLVFLGTCSKANPNVPIIMGPKDSTAEILGWGNLAQCVSDCQKNMGDSALVVVPANADILGSVQLLEKSQDADMIILNGEAHFDAGIEIKAFSLEDLKISWEGAKNFSENVVVPEDRVLSFSDAGITVTLPDTINAGDRWFIQMNGPKASLESLNTALTRALDIYTPEAVFVCQDSSSSDVAYWNAQAEKFFAQDHKPVHIFLESSLSDTATQSYEVAISEKVRDFSKISARFVSVLCQPGEITEGNAKIKRQPLGLLAATISNSAVNQSIGATRTFIVDNFTLPHGWSNSHSRALDEGRFITLRSYAGLRGIFWSNGRTFADDASDYRFVEIVRTVHKALRLARAAVLPCLHAPGDVKGVKEVLARIRTSLNTMTNTVPSELLGFELSAPEGQDLVNNGLQVEIQLFGVPIIRTITLNFMYKYRENA